MGSVQVEVKVQDVEEFKEMAMNAFDLVEQIEKSDFKDENGHDLKMNKAFLDLQKSIEHFSK